MRRGGLDIRWGRRRRAPGLGKDPRLARGTMRKGEGEEGEGEGEKGRILRMTISDS